MTLQSRLFVRTRRVDGRGTLHENARGLVAESYRPKAASRRCILRTDSETSLCPTLALPDERFMAAMGDGKPESSPPVATGSRSLTDSRADILFISEHTIVVNRAMCYSS